MHQTECIRHVPSGGGPQPPRRPVEWGATTCTATTIVVVPEPTADTTDIDLDAGEGSAVTTVYTDGACSGNPGPGGWAWATTDGRQDSGGDPDTTNQRMELTAVLEALRVIDGAVSIYSDSTYVVNCYNERWYDGWIARNWRNSQRKPVANRDLWEPLVEIFERRRPELSFTWVKGHSGDPMNDLVDALAVAEIDKLRTPADNRSSAASTDAAAAPPAPWPVERAVAVTGAAEPTQDSTESLTDAIAGLDPGYDIVVSGLRRGAELSAGELAIEHRIPLAVVLPFADPADRWPSGERRRFDRCVDEAEWVVTLDGDRRKPGSAVMQRNQWLWSSVVGVIVVEDPKLADQLDELGLGVISIEGE